MPVRFAVPVTVRVELTCVDEFTFRVRPLPLSPLAPAPAYRTRQAFAEPILTLDSIAAALGRWGTKRSSTITS